MTGFVDHLQIVPMPSVGGVRQPDGDHRPGGLGMRTVGDRLARRGWTARLEDIGFDVKQPARRIAESYARSIGDAVLSAWDRSRFPIVLGRENNVALGVVDALGERTGIVWIGPRAEYRTARLLRRPAFDRTSLALVTGRAARDAAAVRPRCVPGSRVVLVGGGRARRNERRALAEDGVRVVGSSALDELVRAVDAVDADGWYLHVDLGAVAADAAPAADEARPDGVDPAALSGAVRDALEGRPLRCAAFTRYDLNRDREGRTAATLVELIETAVAVAGGQPRPEAAERAGGEA